MAGVSLPVKRSKNGKNGNNMKNLENTQGDGLECSSPSSDVSESPNEVETQPPVQSQDSSTNVSGGVCPFLVKYLWFVFRTTLFLFSLYIDIKRINDYITSGETWHAFISIVILVMPSLMYAFYQTNLGVLQSKDACPLVRIFVNGFHLIAWQLKSHLDLVLYVLPKLGFNKKPTMNEIFDMRVMEKPSATYDFFYYFYAGFPKAVFLLHFGLKNNHWPPAPEIILCLVVTGYMTWSVGNRKNIKCRTFSSFFGWFCFISTRIFYASMLCLHSCRLVVLALGGHALFASWGLYKLAQKSAHQVNASSTVTEEENGLNLTTDRRDEMNRTPSRDSGMDMSNTAARQDKGTMTTLKDFSYASSLCEQRLIEKAIGGFKKVSFFSLIVVLFGIPSIAYWPFIFQLGNKVPVFTFLGITLIENIIVWACLIVFKVAESTHIKVYSNWSWTVFAISFLVLGIYGFFKESEADAKAIERAKSEVQFYGIFYEFFEKLFVMPIRREPNSDNMQNNILSVTFRKLKGIFGRVSNYVSLISRPLPHIRS